MRAARFISLMIDPSTTPHGPDASAGLRPATGRAVIWVAALIVLAAAWTGGASGCGGDGAPFEALRLTADSEELPRNAEIRVEFSRRIAKEAPLRSLVKVRDASGREIPIRVRQSDRTCVLGPDDPSGWPIGALRVEIERGHAAAFRSADGAALATDKSFAVKVSPHYADLGVLLTVDAAQETFLTNVERDFAFSLRFSLPIDPRCLEDRTAPIRMECRRSEGTPLVWTPLLAIEADGRTVTVKPWSEATPFFAGREHVLRITTSLRSLTGRRLESEHVVTLLTSPGGEDEGFLDIGFGANDLEPRDAAALRAAGAAFARPVPAPVRAEVLHDERSVDMLGHASPFARGAGRLQFRIPAKLLQAEPGLITGFSWKTHAPVPPGIVFPRLILRVGHGLQDVLGLEPSFDRNFAALRAGGVDGENVHETVPAAGTTASGQVLPSGAWSPQPGPDDRWQRIDFERPFPYRGGRDLIVEIVNEQGIAATAENAAPPEALLWRARRAGPVDEAQALWSVGGLAGEVVAGNLVFATKIHIERYLELETRWYDAFFLDPVYSILPTADHLIATGEENEDFRFLYKGRRADGAETEWSPVVRRLDGFAKVKVKIVFLHGSRKDPGGVEVKRLRIRYKKKR